MSGINSENLQFGPVTLLKGDESFGRKINGLLESNLPRAADQADRFGRAKILVVNPQCPDVRYRHPLDPSAQEELSYELGAKAVLVPINDFGAGADPENLQRDLPRKKRVLFLYQPHAKALHPDGRIIEGCGAQNAKSELDKLPDDLAKAIATAVIGKTTDEHSGWLGKSLGELDQGEGVVAPILHDDRAIASHLIDYSGESETPGRLAQFLTSTAGEKFVEDFQGLPPGVNTATQDAMLATVEVGAALMRFGGLVTLVDDHGPAGQPFNINAQESFPGICAGLVKQRYPNIARHHGNFSSLEGLVVSARPEVLSEVEKAIAKTGIDRKYGNVAVVDTSALFR